MHVPGLSQKCVSLKCKVPPGSETPALPSEKEGAISRAKCHQTAASGPHRIPKLMRPRCCRFVPQYSGVLAQLLFAVIISFFRKAPSIIYTCAEILSICGKAITPVPVPHHITLSSSPLEACL